MKGIRAIKHLVGKRRLALEPEAERVRRGSNFKNADRVALLYLDTDEEQFKRIRHYAKFLKEEFSIRSVYSLGFVDENEKRIPSWQSHKLESEFFSRDELNWYMKPFARVRSFGREEFDILIDFSGGRVLPINFLIKASRSGMKVGIKGTDSEKYLDLILDLGRNADFDKYIEQLNTYLSNPRIA